MRLPLQKGMAFFQEMKSYGLQPDSSAYGAALAIAVRAKKARLRLSIDMPLLTLPLLSLTRASPCISR
jgi:hypothetical protein